MLLLQGSMAPLVQKLKNVMYVKGAHSFLMRNYVVSTFALKNYAVPILNYPINPPHLQYA